MRIVVDENVPEEYVRAVDGDGHDLVSSREVPEPGPSATDLEVVRYAERESMAVLTTDVKDFASLEASVLILVAPQDTRGGEVRRAVARPVSLDLDVAAASPVWLSALFD